MQKKKKKKKKKKTCKKLHKNNVNMKTHNECDSLTSRHKITQEKLICHQKSIHTKNTKKNNLEINSDIFLMAG